MPKELINDSTQQRWHTEVSWRRRPGLDADDQGTSPGHVQLASVNLDSPFEFPEREQDGAWEAGERFDGWRVTLDEAGIDRLIKALHKAKHQAFGPSPEAVARAEALVGYGYSNEEISRLSGLSEVTVESDATAASRLDTDRYRATRRGDR